MERTADIEAPRGQELLDAIDCLERWGSDRGWVGSDPYEGLNARRAGRLMRHPLGRRVVIQAVKRSPVDVRPALGIAPTTNAAALGHALSAYSRLDRLGDRRERGIEYLVRTIREQRTPGYEEPCWNYPFDVESRVFFYPSTTPNTISTVFVALGLLDAYEATGDRELLETAEGSGDFFLNHVPQTPAGDGAFFGYFPGDRTPIHNANALVCGLLGRLAAATGRNDFRDAAEAGLRYTLDHQRPEGSWPYGETPNLGWVDGFHTGYVLDSLQRCFDVLDSDELRAAHRRGIDFYAERLFLADGTPKYFEDRVHPIDAQSVAQGIATFALAARIEPGWLDSAQRVCRYALSRMRRPDGAFVFQRGRVWVNRAPHMRWVQAPMFDALALLEATASVDVL